MCQKKWLRCFSECESGLALAAGLIALSNKQLPAAAYVLTVFLAHILRAGAGGKMEASGIRVQHIVVLFSGVQKFLIQAAFAACVVDDNSGLNIVAIAGIAHGNPSCPQIFAVAVMRSAACCRL